MGTVEFEAFFYEKQPPLPPQQGLAVSEACPTWREPHQDSWCGLRAARVGTPAGEGGGVARAQKYKLIHPHSHPTPCLSFPWVNAGAAGWCLVGRVAGWVVFGGASWCLGENGDEEVFPYCINEYLYD
uniref:Uncharacterized protein n=1 Tax=Sus scrofa TaxID=9823 RepID=A0A8W4FDU2_PIG